MSNNSTQIWAATLAETGASFYAAPLGTVLPTSAVAVLDPAFLDLGWMGDDGFTNSPKRTVKKIKAFGGDVVKTVQTDYAETIKATCYETNPNVLRTVFGVANVIVGSRAGHRTIQVNHDSSMLPRMSFIIDSIDGVKLRRLVVQQGEITEISDLKYVHSDVLKYSFTVDCYIPATSIGGATSAVIEYVDEPDVIPGS